MSNYKGKHFLNDVTYREAEGLANSDAQMIEKNPGNFIWSKSAPRNGAKSKTTDIGYFKSTSGNLLLINSITLINLRESCGKEISYPFIGQIAVFMFPSCMALAIK